MARPEEYDDSPVAADSLLSVEEIDALVAAGGRPLGRDARKILHFLTRVGLTMRAYRQQIQALHRDVTAGHLARERAGQPTTLNPLDAVRYLHPDQLTQVFDGHMREKLVAIERTLGEAGRARTAANTDINRIKFAVMSLLEDPTLPAAVRERFSQLLARLPEVVAPPVMPAGLADPVRRPDPGQAAPPAPATPEAGLDDLFG